MYMYMYSWNLYVYLYLRNYLVPQRPLIRKDHTFLEGGDAPTYKADIQVSHFMRWFANPNTALTNSKCACLWVLVSF